MKKTIITRSEMAVYRAEGAITLTKLPEVAFMDGLFPLLDNNELLRLRRVNKGLKKITDLYFRSHAPSQREIELKLNLARASGKSSLTKFLEDTRKCSIKMPSSVFKMECSGPKLDNSTAIHAKWLRQLQTPEMDDFLLKYGNQIRSLTIRHMTLPIERDSAQFKFFERIPKLRELHIMELTSALESEEEVSVDTATATAAAGYELPNCFKTTLKELYVKKFEVYDDDDDRRHCLWKLVAGLKKLETFQPPSSFYSIDGVRFGRPWYDLFENLNQIVKNKTINTVDFSLSNDHTIIPTEELTFPPEFTSCCVSNKIKCTYVSPQFLSKMDRRQVVEFVNCIASMKYSKYRCIHDFPDLVFSNLVKLSMNLYPSYDDHLLFPTLLPLATIQETFTMARFPALRVLELHLYKDSELYNRVLHVLWTTFVNLEELYIYCHIGRLGNEAFFGSDVGTPPVFLQLTKLKKFLLEIPPQHGLTDAVFSQVFGQMRLTEFYLTSDKPIKRISINAIRSLLTGPFIESIKKFPFHDWSLSRTSPEEFMELARKFPNNQPL